MSSTSPPKQEAPEDATVPPRELTGPRVLPYRDVTSSSIEDAYIQFIVYCNPALPMKADVASLRESFRNPPRSGGKAFDPFVIFQLVRQFYNKEIRTWAELTIKLGVEPPDPTKEESTQKIAQYGVRLKKWMNSMHVKAFFEYLMNIQNDYWTQIPGGQDPIAVPVRDGVAFEDDMALRALLPHIRPKRGRKRPDEDENPYTPVQRPRLSPSSAVDDHRHSTQHVWPSSEGHHLQSNSEGPRSAIPSWNSNENAQTPQFRWPQSAVTPTTRAGFWEDPNEPRSAVTPSKLKPSNQRRGAKNVSSAWKTGGPEQGGKTRGRPPINRTPVEGPSFASAPWPSSQHTPTSNVQYTQAPLDMSASRTSMDRPSTQGLSGASTAAPYSSQIPERRVSAPVIGISHADGTRPSRPSISLQVPERPTGSVRLATPPAPAPVPPAPSVTLNGAAEPRPSEYTYDPAQSSMEPNNRSGAWTTWTSQALDAYGETPPRQNTNTTANASAATNGNSAGTSSSANNNGNSKDSNIGDFYFEKIEDRTNVDTLMSYFIQAAFDADWYNADGTPGQRASLEEATAIVNTAMQTMYKSANSPQVFLINLAALAGARHLMNRRARYIRRGGDENFRNYSFEWEYRFGHVHGKFTMLHKVPRSMWPIEDPPPVVPPSDQGEGEPSDEAKAAMSATDWQKKYENLLKDVESRNKEMWELRTRVMGWGRGGV